MLGEELRKSREAAGMTQEQLSFKAGVHRVYISELERNLKSPTVEVLFRVCEAMKISASKLLARVEKGRG